MRIVRVVVIGLVLMCGNAYAEDGTYAIDYGCVKLNAAFERTRNSDKYQEITYLERHDKSIQEQFRSQFDEAKRYEKSNGSKWKVVRRELTELNEFGVPYFTAACRFRIRH
jgi:lantibiotic modifying enzyme